MRCSPATIIKARLLTTLGTLGRSLEQAVLPNACVFCGATRGLHQPAICDGCHAELPWNDNACARCANPVASPLPAGVHCAACQMAPPLFTAAIAPLEYAFPIDAAIKAMKFRRKLFYVPAFAHVIGDALRDLPDDIDSLLPVPLHWRRQALRGFNHALEICKPIQRRTGLRLVKNVVRARATPYQSGLNAAHRRRNLEGAFAVRGTLATRHVLIVDDVMTTGETCRQLADLLLESGVDRVSVLALARARPG